MQMGFFVHQFFTFLLFGHVDLHGVRRNNVQIVKY